MRHIVFISLLRGIEGVPSGSPSSPIAKEKRELEGDEVILFISSPSSRLYSVPMQSGKGIKGMVSRL